MSSPTYTEPRLAVLVLDHRKPLETYYCLQSIKRHIKVPHTVIYCDNGSQEDYPLGFVRQGLVDQLIVNRDSRGLGLGTQDIVALARAPWAIMMQNDQLFVRDLTEQDLDEMTSRMFCTVPEIVSISLAGAPCGDGIYSERAHLFKPSVYHRMEREIPLGYHGAGPYHDGVWRERQIQDHYRDSYLTHLIWPQPFVADNGVFAVRDMKESGLWCHRTDTKTLWCIRPPTVRNPAYPKLSDAEWLVAELGDWPKAGAIPVVELKDSFDCWGQSPLARAQDQYIADLRQRETNKVYRTLQ